MVNKHTSSMMAMLPQWMKMAKDEQSVGAKFLDAFGIELEDVEVYLDTVWENMHVGTANLQTIDYCYKIPLDAKEVSDTQTGLIVTIIKDSEEDHCWQAKSLKDFFESQGNIFIYDAQEGYLYIKPNQWYMQGNIYAPFHAISINNNAHYDYLLHHIWNIFDEFGMLLGIKRLPGERNEAFKNRILDVFKNPGGAHKQGLKNGISRELGISKEDIKLGSLADEQYVRSELINEDGSPSERYIRYVNQINATLGFSWDHMTWGEAFWRSMEEDNMGIHYLPHIWDGFSFEWKDNEVRSGIGDGDDLLVEKPKRESSTRKFKAYVGLRGTEEQVEESHPEIHFKYKITANGKVPNEEHPAEKYRYAIYASEIIQLHYILSAYRLFLYQTHIDWSDRYPFIMEDVLTPGIEVISGETVLHNEDETHVRLHVELKTTDRTVTPRLEGLMVEWQDVADKTHVISLADNDDFLQVNPSITTSLVDVEVKNNGVQLSKGVFSAVVDTESSFLKGSPSLSVQINRNGSISLKI